MAAMDKLETQLLPPAWNLKLPSDTQLLLQSSPVVDTVVLKVPTDIYHSVKHWTPISWFAIDLGLQKTACGSGFEPGLRGTDDLPLFRVNYISGILTELRNMRLLIFERNSEFDVKVEAIRSYTSNGCRAI
ncbi:hypothetical protein chiPu_0007988 [Chiloscyllium punctatum]|uniref:Uncharacterized protein n=1 Tax=Chiloscyllium punctatum TaxID=137246 RepID=A0A401SGK7_CHIPU|nr:hypothetical protein [Chiloscyllium punctatum]